MELTGTIKLVRDTQEVSASFKKREFVVTTEEQYPQDILLEMTQAKCEDLDNIQVGEQVKVSINLRGREWVNPQGEVKYFNTIQGWRIDKDGGVPIEQREEKSQTGFAPSEEVNSDLPF
jgi:hypothetical protein